MFQRLRWRKLKQLWSVDLVEGNFICSHNQELLSPYLQYDMWRKVSLLNKSSLDHKKIGPKTTTCLMEHRKLTSIRSVQPPTVKCMKIWKEENVVSIETNIDVKTTNYDTLINLVNCRHSEVARPQFRTRLFCTRLFIFPQKHPKANTIPRNMIQYFASCPHSYGIRQHCSCSSHQSKHIPYTYLKRNYITITT